MRKALIIVLIFSFISCSSSKLKNRDIISETNFNDLKIAKTSTVIDSDTLNFNELRFYGIDSAFDTMKTMYLDFGMWTNEFKSLHNENFNRKVWEDIKLFENDEVFTVIADGIETVNNYYACLIVFDSNGKDCLQENHPLKNKTINLFNNKMKENRSKKINYSILR